MGSRKDIKTLNLPQENLTVTGKRIFPTFSPPFGKFGVQKGRHLIQFCA